MAGVTIKELGLAFVRVCMENYWSGCILPVFFLLGILWDIFYHKKKEAWVFLYYVIFLALTAYNPFLVRYTVPKMNFENEYYRLIWILPVIPGVAYYAVRLVGLAKAAWAKILLAVVLGGMIIVSGTPIPGIVQNFSVAENIYKVPDDLRAVCDVIHKDSEKEQPRVVFGNDMNMVARQYDPSLILVLNRNYRLYRAGSTVVGNYEKLKNYQIQKVIMDVVSYQMTDTDMNSFKASLDATKTDYIVVQQEDGCNGYLREAGCRPVAQTEEYMVYRYGE